MKKYFQIEKSTQTIIGIKSSTHEPIESDEYRFIDFDENLVIEQGHIYTVDINNNITDTGMDSERKIRIISSEVQKILDSKAQEYGYDSILSACSYASFANPFQAEGQAFTAWRGDVWAYCYQELDKIEQGLRTEPTIEAFMLELPTLTL